MDVTREHLSVKNWETLIRSAETGAMNEPIVNVNQEDPRPYDAIFIGGGAGGRFGAAYLQARGGRPLVIDRWPFLGGSCPHQACVPHHLFSEVAREMDYMRWNSDTLWFPKFDESRASILDVVELFRNGRNNPHAFMNWQSKEQLAMEFILNAPATVIDARTVEVAGRRYACSNIVLATGARTHLPDDIAGLRKPGVFDFASFVDHHYYEQTICEIIGGSKVAMEYGTFFQSAGCDTTILTRSPLMHTASLHHIDADLRSYVVRNMERRGITIVEGAEPLEVLGDDRVTGVRFRDADGNERVIATDFVFVATGERPHTQPFVDALGIEVDDRGFVQVNARMETSVPGVYAVGDLIGSPMEMFKARKCGVTAARNILGDAHEFHFEECPDFFHTTYEVTWTGLTEAEAVEQFGDDVVVIQLPPKGVKEEDIPLPLAEGAMLYGFTRPELTGFQKLVVERRSRRIVGAHHVGFGAKDAFQYLDHLIKKGFTIDEMGELNELFLNPDHFIQYSRLVAGNARLRDF
jgi:dihydrolipoamide dehydrogenase